MLQTLSKYGYTCAAWLLFGPDIDYQDVHYARRTALINVVENNSPLLVKILITAGANLDLQDSNGNTALMFAVRTCNKDLVKMLIVAGANLDLQNNRGNTALMFAIYSTAAIVKILIEAGANVNSQNIPLANKYKIQEYLNIYRAQIDNISSLNYLEIDPFIN